MAQTAKAPLTARFIFEDPIANNAVTDYYELCIMTSAPSNCSRHDRATVVQTERPGNWTFDRVFNTGPHSVAIRSCNAVGCSGFSNQIATPTVVTASPGIPSTLRVVIIVPSTP